MANTSTLIEIEVDDEEVEAQQQDEVIEIEI